jgi:cytochrome c oxidase subunit 4
MNSRSGEHHPHILPLKVYLGVGAILLALTGITIAVSFVHLGPFNIVVALAIAVVKALLVAFVFMHLYYDNKLYFMFFASTVLFLMIFIGFTMIDTMQRADLYPEVGTPIRSQAAMYDSLAADSGATQHEEGEAPISPADTAKPAGH